MNFQGYFNNDQNEAHIVNNDSTSNHLNSSQEITASILKENFRGFKKIESSQKAPMQPKKKRRAYEIPLL